VNKQSEKNTTKNQHLFLTKSIMLIWLWNFFRNVFLINSVLNQKVNKDE